MRASPDEREKKLGAAENKQRNAGSEKKGGA
jgi:hypothetical protein